MSKREEDAAKKKARFDKLFDAMQFCPICAETLKIMGTRKGSAIKICERGHGAMYVTGQRSGSKVGMFLEIYEE